jgi:hypothetical protein
MYCNRGGYKVIFPEPYCAMDFVRLIPTYLFIGWAIGTIYFKNAFWIFIVYRGDDFSQWTN